MLDRGLQRLGRGLDNTSIAGLTNDSEVYDELSNGWWGAAKVDKVNKGI